MLAVVIWVTPGVLSMIYGAKADIVKDFNKFLPEELSAMIGGLLLFGGGLAMGSMMYTTGLSTSLGFMMPVSTPPNAIVYASGFIPITKMIKSGIIIDFFGIFLITIPVVLLLVKFVVAM